MATFHDEAPGYHLCPANGLYMHTVKELKVDLAEAITLHSTNLKVGSATTITKFSTDGTLAGNSDAYSPTEKAVKTYTDAHFAHGTFNVIFTGPWGVGTLNVTITYDRSGDIITLQIPPGVGAASVAVAATAAPATVPAALRPTAQSDLAVLLNDNGLEDWGIFQIHADGSITVMPVTGGFAGAGNAGFVGNSNATYSRL